MNTESIRDIARLERKQAMPASKSVCLLQNQFACYKFQPNGAEIRYYWAKARKFSRLPALAQNPGYVTLIH